MAGFLFCFISTFCVLSDFAVVGGLRSPKPSPTFPAVIS